MVFTSKGINSESKNQNMKTTHLLEVRIKSSNRLHLKAEFETKADALVASYAILRANADKFLLVISYIGK